VNCYKKRGEILEINAYNLTSKLSALVLEQGLDKLRKAIKI
jgi:hypothetical protein